MRAFVPLLAASLATLVFALVPAPASHSWATAQPRRAALGPAHPAARLAPRIECDHPRLLRLRRFEDGSARLECAGRLLLRVSVPG